MNTTNTQPKENQGFALITVLVISFLGSLIVFDTIQENLNQERMAGNYTKELNARLQAENGLAEAYNMLSTDSSLSTDDMMTQLNSAQNSSGGYYHNIDAWLDSDIREINSSGFHYDGTYAMRGSFSLTSSSGNSVFTGAITTCDGATLGGSGTIDSYDSSEGAYDSSNPGNNGDVSVLNEDASGLTLSGSSPIDGSVSINGDLTMSGSASISGDAHVSGNIDLGSSGSH
ncbi:pilus assembly PilX family protein [Psychromonas sp. GE-S-Ul-11]|uniref:pilus assembly PilX family protein n=1 Tax=Psychromonas sp. GE-S-Ul-11 TaxID=3241170 RepID=UPI003AAA23B8